MKGLGRIILMSTFLMAKDKIIEKYKTIRFRKQILDFYQQGSESKEEFQGKVIYYNFRK